jgi:uncharacterized membrane protein YphA (DoxX/SURF4 family)
MLSLFPSLLSFDPLAPFLLRLTLAAILIHWAYGHIKYKKQAGAVAIGLIEGVIGILFVIGLFTQLAALVAIVLLPIKLIQKIKAGALFTDGVNYYFIVLIIAVSLLFMGPGAYSFDLPL